MIGLFGIIADAFTQKDIWARIKYFSLIMTRLTGFMPWAIRTQNNRSLRKKQIIL